MGIEIERGNTEGTHGLRIEVPYKECCPMRILIEMELEVKIPADRANVNEIFMAVQSAMANARSEAATKVIEGYEEQVIKTL